MSGLRQFTPPSMKGLNFNIDSDLIFTTFYSKIKNVGAIYGINPLDLYSHLATSISDYGSRILIYQDYIQFTVVNAARTTYLNCMRVMGGDTPYMDMLTHRIAALAHPTTDMDAAPVAKMWQAWTPTLTWTTANPLTPTVRARYCQIGKVVYFTFDISSTDSNATAGLTVTLPSTNGSTTPFFCYGFERAGAAGATYYPAYIWIAGSSNILTYLNFIPGTDNQAIWLTCSGFYEVA